MKILYAAYGKAGLDILYCLLNQSEVCAEDILCLTYDLPQNREFLRHLRALDIMHVFGKPGDSVALVEAFEPDFLFSIYYRDIIPPKILSRVKYASVNLHPSLLPLYKGCFSSTWNIINGEKTSGISFHLMTSKVDSGALIMQKGLPINADDTAFSLNHRLVALAVENFPDLFHLVVRAGYTGEEQIGSGFVYPRALPYDGLISLDWGSARIAKFIRALYHPPFRPAVLDYGDKLWEFYSVEDFMEFCEGKAISLKP